MPLPEPAATVGLPAEALQTVFPFHFAFDRDLHVVQVAPSLRKLLPELTVGYKVSDFFRIATPSVPFAFDAISEQSFTVFFIESLDQRFKLKGQMLRTQSGIWDLMIFLGSPLIREMGSVSGLGLTLKDFAIHDSVIDFLILLQTKTNTINDVKSMADRLKKEVAERREAQKALQQTNEQLEARVRERTRELEEHNYQMVLLNAMGDMLQSCRSVRETAPVIADCLSRLLPGESGFLLMLEPGGHYDVVTVWGQAMVKEGDSLSEDACRALLDADAAHVAMPLTAQGDRHGWLFVHGRAPDEEVDSHRQQLLHSVSEHISLAIANIKLQEHLRQQSIRDMLTGLYNRRYMEEALPHEVARADRGGKQCSVIMLDVDHFKKFNDSLGHQAGDALLSGLGKFLHTHVRGEDVACRYGGEEFILILPGATPDGAYKRAEEIRAQVETVLRVPYENGLLPPVTLSLGIATYPLHAHSAADTVKAADAALYRAKRDGRNRVVTSDGDLSKS